MVIVDLVQYAKELEECRVQKRIKEIDQAERLLKLSNLHKPKDQKQAIFKQALRQHCLEVLFGVEKGEQYHE